MSRKVSLKKSIRATDARISPLDRLPQRRPSSTDRATRRQGRSLTGRYTRERQSSDLRVLQTCNAGCFFLLVRRRLGAKLRRLSYAPPIIAPLILRQSIGWNRFFFLRSKSHVVQRHPDDAADHCEIPNPLQRSLPQAHRPGDPRITG